MTFYRHFIEKEDFQTLVATNSPLVDKYEIAYDPVIFETPAPIQRFMRTRFHRWAYAINDLWEAHPIPSVIWEEAQLFQPEAVFTVAGSWDWTALLARRVAHRLGLPLIASFNDWFYYGRPYPQALMNILEKRFRRFYQEADLALCTCEGMQEALGPHPNSHILYPTGAAMDEAPTGTSSPKAEIPFTVFFGGSLGDCYGPMLENLVRTSTDQESGIRFRIFGGNQTWNRAFEEWAASNEIFQGQVPFSTLSAEAKKADLLILPMGFDEGYRQVESTSFKTKFLDYLTFHRPILVWGPEYCSAVRTAREFDSAEICLSPSADSCLKAIIRLSENPARLKALQLNAHSMYKDRFHPNLIHRGLVDEIQTLLSKFGKS